MIYKNVIHRPVHNITDRSFRTLVVQTLVIRKHGNMASKINYNTKHLTKGDPLPPFTGKLRVYSMRYCPFAQRTILTLNAKKVDYEVVNINLYEKPEWYHTKSALGKVPAVEFKENATVYESLITVEYLDEVYPQRPLLPKDPYLKAQDKIIVESSNMLLGLFFQVMRGTEITDDAVKNFHNGLDFIQQQLKTRGTKLLDGEQPGYADYMIWPIFERIFALEDIEPKLKIDADKYTLLLQYLKIMQEDPVVKEYIVPKELGQKFLAAYKKNPPNLDYTLFYSLN